MEYSDEALVRAIKSGDDAAMDILVRRWYPRIYSYNYKLLCDKQDAHDVTQDTFLAMIQNIKQFRLLTKFQNWIFSIAHNKCMDFFRLQRRMLLVDIDSIEDYIANDVNEHLSNRVIVENAIEKLSVVQRETIILYYFQGFTVREISRITNTAIPTIKSRLTAAKRNLAGSLQEAFYE